MDRRTINLVLVLVLFAAAIWVALPNNPGIHIGTFNRSLETVLGLDLRGGMQVLLEADVPAEKTVDSQSLQDAMKILENRSNGLGVSEVVFQVAGSRRIVGEFPGLTNTEQVISVLKETGQMEFVDLGKTPLKEGSVIKTDFATSASSQPISTPKPVQTIGPGATPVSGTTQAPEEKVWHTIMTGKDLKSVAVTTGQLNQVVVQFELSPEGKKIFADYTTKNVGSYLAIALDKQIISAPVIKSAITEGSGIIEGSFTVQSANDLAIQLRYGSLPVPLKVMQSQVVGPTLGQESVRKSIIAGLIGMAIVILFMGIFYRVPGIVADLALIEYAAITFAFFKLIPVTLTLPGIAGFVLGIGVAVDANILIFERMKEELRAGRTLRQAIDLGWKRAWPSIRDSNISTLITCAILFWFGSTFGATIVKGFSLTLALSVMVSLFTAIIVTRTFLHTVLDNLKFTEHPKWFGVVD